MALLLLSGSTRAGGANEQLLRRIAAAFPARTFQYFNGLTELPLFLAENDRAPWPETVARWRAAAREAEAVVISTPEYLHNLPALLKNALEWLTSSGEWADKPVLVITYAPHAPRGERAGQSLLWSLDALNARVVAHLPLYQNECYTDEKCTTFTPDTLELLTEALQLLPA